MEAKRVILRLRDSDFPNVSYNDLVNCVKSFLTFSGRSPEELAQDRHFFHFQPPNPDIPQENPRFHIIIDVEKSKHSGPLQKGFPHEIYRVSRRDDEMYVMSIDCHLHIHLLTPVDSIIIPFQNIKEHDNFIHKLRFFSDKFYRWGSQEKIGK